MIALTVICVLLAFAAAYWISKPLTQGPRRWIAPALTVAVVIAASAAYMAGGRPGLPGLPHEQAVQQRRDAAPSALSFAEQIERLRDEVRADPSDSDAWALLGRQLARAEQEQEAINAFRRALQIDPAARTFSDLGQTLINLNDGDVTDDARRAFEAAMARDPALPEPYFFLGLDAYQAGDRAAAAQYWTMILARLPEGDPFLAVIARQAVDLLSRPDADARAVAAAEGEMADPEARIAQMVAGLEARLAAEPDDISGWLVLIRVRRTLDDGAGARQALAAAREQFAGDAGALVLLQTAGSLLGLDEEDPS